MPYKDPDQRRAYDKARRDVDEPDAAIASMSEYSKWRLAYQIIQDDKAAGYGYEDIIVRLTKKRLPYKRDRVKAIVLETTL